MKNLKPRAMEAVRVVLIDPQDQCGFEYYLPSILRVSEECLVNPFDASVFLTWFSAPYYRFAVAVNSQEEVVAFILFSVQAFSCEIKDLAVAKRHQHRGIGSQIIRWLIGRQDKDNITTFIWPSRRSFSFFRELGFECVGRLSEKSNKFGEHPLILMYSSDRATEKPKQKYIEKQIAFLALRLRVFALRHRMPTIF